MSPKKSKFIKKRYQAEVYESEQPSEAVIEFDHRDLPLDDFEIDDGMSNYTFDIQAVLFEQLQQRHQQKPLKEQAEQLYYEDDIVPNNEVLVSQRQLQDSYNQQFEESDYQRHQTVNCGLIKSVVQEKIIPQKSLQADVTKAQQDNNTINLNKIQSLQSIKRQLFELILKKEIRELHQQNLYLQDDYEVSRDAAQIDVDVDELDQISQFIDQNQSYLQIHTNFQPFNCCQKLIRDQIQQILQEQIAQNKQKHKQVNRKQPRQQKQLIQYSKQSIFSIISQQYLNKLKEAPPRSATLNRKFNKKQNGISNETDYSDFQQSMDNNPKKKLSFCEIIGVKTFKLQEQVDKITSCIQCYEGINLTDKLPRRNNNKKTSVINQQIKVQLQQKKKLQSRKVVKSMQQSCCVNNKIKEPVTINILT